MLSAINYIRLDAVPMSSGGVGAYRNGSDTTPAFVVHSDGDGTITVDVSGPGASGRLGTECATVLQNWGCSVKVCFSRRPKRENQKHG